MKSAFDSLVPLIEKKAIIKDPQQFHALVNVIFHDHESILYDEVHTEMWESLPEQFELIAHDIETKIDDSKTLRLLDIGCGTGLSTQMLLDTSLGIRITEIDLLDTSGEMLKKAKKRSENWEKKVRLIQGETGDLNNQKYDVILVSSVLHHIPDINRFLTDIAKLQSPGSIFVTIHDPNAEAIQSKIYHKRCHEYQAYASNQTPLKPNTIIVRAYNKIKRLFKPGNYIQKVNNDLLKKNIIAKPLTESELWSVTDIHVESLPYSASNGISKKDLSTALKNYNLLSYRTYSFFGLLISNLDSVYKVKETELILANDQFGRNFSSVWIKQD